jgi:hypothetical protein
MKLQNPKKKQDYEYMKNTVELLKIFKNMDPQGMSKIIKGFEYELESYICPTCNKKGVYFK